MSKSLKLTLAVALVAAALLAFFLTRPVAPKPAAWDGSALLAKALQTLEEVPAKEAETLRALLVSTGPGRYDDRASAWFKTSLKEDLKLVTDYALASLRAMAEAGDAAAMWYLHFVLIQRIATGDEGFQWLDKAAKAGYPRAVYDVTREKLKGRPDKLRAAMEDFAKREDDAAVQALYWFAFGHDKGQDGLPKDPTKAEQYRQRAKALSDKLHAAEQAK